MPRKKKSKISFTRQTRWYPPEFNDAFKRRIRKRDGLVCSICRRKKRLDVHHIDYTKRTVPENCISLCRDCHKMVHASSSLNKRAWKMKLLILVGHREMRVVDAA